MYYIAALFLLLFWTSFYPIHVSEEQISTAHYAQLTEKGAFATSTIPTRHMPIVVPPLLPLPSNPRIYKNSPVSFPTSLPTLTFVLPSPPCCSSIPALSGTSSCSSYLMSLCLAADNLAQDPVPESDIRGCYLGRTSKPSVACNPFL